MHSIASGKLSALKLFILAACFPHGDSRSSLSVGVSCLSVLTGPLVCGKEVGPPPHQSPGLHGSGSAAWGRERGERSALIRGVRPGDSACTFHLQQACHPCACSPLYFPGPPPQTTLPSFLKGLLGDDGGFPAWVGRGSCFISICPLDGLKRDPG